MFVYSAPFCYFCNFFCKFVVHLSVVCPFVFFTWIVLPEIKKKIDWLID